MLNSDVRNMRLEFHSLAEKDLTHMGSPMLNESLSVHVEQINSRLIVPICLPGIDCGLPKGNLG